MSDHLIAEPWCNVCLRVATRIELVPPGQHPQAWQSWPADRRAIYTRWHEPESWHLLYEGIGAGNGLGSDIPPEQAERIAHAFTEPFTFDKVHAAGFSDDAGFCQGCGVAYCYKHWGVSTTGYGICPRGHGKSLDPHWHPTSDLTWLR